MPTAILDRMTGNGTLTDESGRALSVSYAVETSEELIAAGSGKFVPGLKERRGWVHPENRADLFPFVLSRQVVLILADGRRLPIVLRDTNDWATVEAMGDFQ